MNSSSLIFLCSCYSRMVSLDGKDFNPYLKKQVRKQWSFFWSPHLSPYFAFLTWLDDVDVIHLKPHLPFINTFSVLTSPIDATQSICSLLISIHRFLIIYYGPSIFLYPFVFSDSFSIPLTHSISLFLISFSNMVYLSVGTTNDYDVTLAVDQLLAYLVSDKGRSVRDILSVQLVEILDTLGTNLPPSIDVTTQWRYNSMMS